MAKLTKNQWKFIGILIEDIFYTVALPLGIVIYVFHDLTTGATPLPHLPSTSPQDIIVAVFPELAFATLFIWALARRRVSACLVTMPFRLDFVVLFGVVLSSLSIGGMLKYTWTGKTVSSWVIGFQISLLVLGIIFNTMITIMDCRFLSKNKKNDEE